MLIGGPCIFLFMRLFELFDYNKSFGVIQTCIGKMLHQMAKWMVPMLFLDLAFSTAFSVMAPNYHAENSGAPLRIMANLDLSTGGSFWLPFWGMYGIVGPQEVGASPECAILAPFLLWFYLLIALVLFINLLIGTRAGSGVDNLGHVGGAATGFVLGLAVAPAVGRRSGAGDDGDGSLVPAPVTQALLAATLLVVGVALRDGVRLATLLRPRLR